jgi:hypothetical protein
MIADDVVRHAIGVLAWSATLWAIMLQTWIPLIPPPASYSSSDDDDPLLIGRNIVEITPPATNAVVLVLALVSLLGIVPAACQRSQHERRAALARRAIVGWLIGTGAFCFLFFCERLIYFQARPLC